jgi:hypothetical protein
VASSNRRSSRAGGGGVPIDVVDAFVVDVVSDSSSALVVLAIDGDVRR